MLKDNLLQDREHKEQSRDFAQEPADHTRNAFRIAVVVIAHLTERAEVLTPSVVIAKYSTYANLNSIFCYPLDSESVSLVIRALLDAERGSKGALGPSLSLSVL